MRTMVAAALWLLLGVAAATAEEPDVRTPEPEIILALQAAVRTDDKDWFVAHLHFPVRYYCKTNRLISRKHGS